MGRIELCIGLDIHNQLYIAIMNSTGTPDFGLAGVRIMLASPPLFFYGRLIS